MDTVISYRELRLIAKGAEAEIVLAEWSGIEVVVKRRTPRGYMNPSLDARIRYRRTIREAESLHEAKLAGVPAPVVYFVDPRSAEIFMQFVRGPRLKEILEEDPRRGAELVGALGEHLGRLHSSGLMHGDPTTSNFVLSGGELFALDFGLSYRSSSADDMAVDLHLLKEALESYHSESWEEAWGAALEGYSRSCARSGEVYRSLERLERAGRYRRGWVAE